MEIKSTVALATGANRGIGAALVQALLDQRASKVYAAARQEADLARLRTARDGRIVPVQLDVTNADQVSRVADQARDVDDSVQQRRCRGLRQRVGRVAVGLQPEF
jgi:NAD(P)-dependent dehydrogenase (short-subunit alcohol dehydrogenase family)